jgi:hypothetical protein
LQQQGQEAAAAAAAQEVRMVLLLAVLVVWGLAATTARVLSMQIHTRCRYLLSIALDLWLSSSFMAAVGVGRCQVVLLPACCEPA